MPIMRVGFDAKRLAVATAAFCAFINLYATQSVLPILREDFHASVAAVNLTVTAATLAVALLAPFAGLVSDWAGRRQPVVLATFLLVLPTAGMAVAPSLDLVTLCRLAQGALVPFIFSATVAFIGEEWAMPEAGRVMALYISGSIVGGFVGRLVPGLFAGWIGWRWGYAALGLANLAGALIVWHGFRSSRPAQAVGRARGLLAGFALHLRNPALLATFAIGFSLLFITVGLFTFASHYLSAPPFLLGPEALGLLFLVYLVGAALTGQAARLTVRFGRRAALRISMAISFAGSVLCLTGNLPLILLGLTLASTGMFIAQTIATTYISISVAQAKSLAVGLYVSAYYLGGSAGPILLAPGWEAYGWAGCVAGIMAAQILPMWLVRFWRESGT
jgi:YNFM family putative membrane transporter